jgi:hypothetical protein
VIAHGGDYRAFLSTKVQKLQPMGFEPGDMNPRMHDWQAECTRWFIRRGRSAAFQGTGLGKTFQQLEWSRHVYEHTGGMVMLHCPIGVRAQTKREAEKFAIQAPVHVPDTQSEAKPGINLVNYEKLHNFDPATFAGVVLDESSVLKNLAGKVKRQLVEGYINTPYRLCCTATPAPNDHMELGNHAEFLGVCAMEDMLSRFFVHDSGDTSKWRLRGHAADHFWSWVASWAICVAVPSDIGGSDEGYNLPPLNIDRHFVEADQSDAPAGFLFNTSGISATNIHEEKRLTCHARCDRAAELASMYHGPSIIWCDTNYEADRLLERMPDAVEVRGADNEKRKEEMLEAFALGQIEKLITKPTIAGFGVNWQHCNHQVFAGLSFSFEQYYQAVRRCWRFGQKRPVYVDIVIANSESSIQSSLARKENDYELMKSGMAKAIRDKVLAEIRGDVAKEKYTANRAVIVPGWIGETL